MQALALLQLARAHWKAIGLALLLLALGVQSLRLGHQRNVSDGLRINLNECRKGRADDRAAYREAQRKAAELNQAEVTRIEKEQEAITHDVQSDLSSRLERLRSELRNAPAKGHSNRPQAGADVPGSPGANEKAGLCLTPEELLSAAESEERHDQLITLIEKQMGVRR